MKGSNVIQNLKKNRKKIIAVTIVLSLSVGIAGSAISKQSKTKAEDSKVISTEVGTGTIKKSVAGTGTISYASSTDIKVPSDLEIDQVIVSAGE